MRRPRPAAVEGQITADNADMPECNLIVEAASGPTTERADQILAARGNRVIPDILASAWGVAVSCFEWTQAMQFAAWTDDEVLDRGGR